MEILSPHFGNHEARRTFSNSLSILLRRPEAGPILVILVWATLSLPHFGLRSFIWEEGTNAEIARDVLAHRHFLEPYIYGIRWSEKPSLLPWLIAGVASLTGQVDEWSARLPSMVSVLLTASLVQRLTRRYASFSASLFASFCFLLSPLLLQKLTIAEPDTVLTFLSFAAFVLWWNGASRGGVSIIRWIGCGCLLSVLAMAKGPQPVGFFALGVLAYLILERQWRELPSFLLCLAFPALATVAWGLSVYRPGDNATWLAYARLDAFPDPFDYAQEKFRTVAQTILELMPGLLVLPFVPWPWRNRRAMSAAVPSVTSPLILYSLVCTVALFFWPGAHSRYAMPIVPSLAVLEGFGWDAIASFKYTPLRRAMAAALGILVAYQFILVVAIMPLYADLFGMSRRDGIAISEAIRLSPAPVYCAGLDTNQLFYVNQRKRCLNPAEWASLAPPAWLLLDPASLARFAGLRPDAKLHVVVETKSGPHLAAVRFE